MRHTANVILVWGIVLLVAGAILNLFGPDLMFAISGSRGQTQLASGVAQVLLSTIDLVLPPLGAAMTAAGIVLRTLAGPSDRAMIGETSESDEDTRIR